MRKCFKKACVITLVAAFCISPIAKNLASYVQAQASESDSTQMYMSTDENGNITMIPMDEVEIPDFDELEAIDNTEYLVSMDINGEKEIVATTNTFDEAQQTAEEIQMIMSQTSTMALAPSNNVLGDDSNYAADPEAQEEADATIDTEITTEKKDIDYGIVIFNNKGASTNTSYTNAKTKADGYLNATYAPDAAYLGTENGKIKFMQAGVIGLVDESEATIVSYDDFVSDGKITNRYKATNGKLYHEITTNLKSVSTTQFFGYQQSYMKSGVNYYSYDGHYFYEDYKVMIDDYKKGTFKNSINADKPYYNYFLFLSHRSTTDLTAKQIDDFILSKTKNFPTSKMRDLGECFIENQNTYGVNASLMVGVAINESYYGTSSIAQNKNNLFGHGATDSNPYYGSNGYDSPNHSVKYHAEKFLSVGYLDVNDWRYFGPHLGNKESGLGIKYASDPYWGEKAASHVWWLEESAGNGESDVHSETIGIVNGAVSAYAEADVNSKVLFQVKNKNFSTLNEVPVIVLSEVTVGNQKWYKVASDTPVNDNRDGIDFNLQYNFDDDYVYMKSSDVNIISGTVEEDIPPVIYMTGDVNLDSKISSVDYMMIKNHIMNINKLTDINLTIADVNKDGKISSADYMMIKNHIMGIASLI